MTFPSNKTFLSEFKEGKKTGKSVTDTLCPLTPGRLTHDVVVGPYPVKNGLVDEVMTRWDPMDTRTHLVSIPGCLQRDDQDDPLDPNPKQVREVRSGPGTGEQYSGQKIPSERL